MAPRTYRSIGVDELLVEVGLHLFLPSFPLGASPCHLAWNAQSCHNHAWGHLVVGGRIAVVAAAVVAENETAGVGVVVTADEIVGVAVGSGGGIVVRAIVVVDALVSQPVAE